MTIYYNDKGVQLGNLLYLCLQVFKDRAQQKEAYVLQNGWYRQAQLMFPLLSDYFAKAQGQKVLAMPPSYYQVHGKDYTSEELDAFCQQVLLPNVEQKIAHLTKKDIVLCIRRTDMYAPHQVNNYGFDVVSYVTDALSQYDKTHSIRVVSDDIDWCKEYLNELGFDNIEFCQTDRVENFWQMLAVNNVLIAPNSTFAYWAGYLLRHLDPTVKVIVPDFNTYLIEQGKQVADTRQWEVRPVKTMLEQINIGVLYVVTGNYKLFFEGFYNTAKKYLFHKNKVTYYVYTDDMAYFEKYKENDDIKFIAIEHKPFPYPTLYRYHFFKRNQEQWQQEEFILFFNANTIFNTYVNSELLPLSKGNIKLWKLPVYDNYHYSELPFEKDVNSIAYVPFEENRQYNYVQGGFIGAFSYRFVELMKIIVGMVDTDKKKEKVPIFHDESYLNKVCFGNPSLIEFIDYDIYLPEEYEIQTPIILLDKKKYGGHTELRYKKLSD